MSTALEQIQNSYDWREAFGYAGEPETCAARYNGGPDVQSMDDAASTPFDLSDVAHIEHHAEGENDGPSWIAVGRLNDGRFFYLSAGCDYTGWD